MKFEIDIPAEEVATIMYNWLVESEMTSESIKKSPSLFPKNPTPEAIKQNRKEWKEYEESLEQYRNELLKVFKKVFKVEFEMTKTNEEILKELGVEFLEDEDNINHIRYDGYIWHPKVKFLLLEAIQKTREDNDKEIQKLKNNFKVLNKEAFLESQKFKDFVKTAKKIINDDCIVGFEKYGTLKELLNAVWEKKNSTLKKIDNLAKEVLGNHKPQEKTNSLTFPNFNVSSPVGDNSKENGN